MAAKKRARALKKRLCDCPKWSRHAVRRRRGTFLLIIEETPCPNSSDLRPGGQDADLPGCRESGGQETRLCYSLCQALTVLVSNRIPSTASTTRPTRSSVCAIDRRTFSTITVWTSISWSNF